MTEKWKKSVLGVGVIVQPIKGEQGIKKCRGEGVPLGWGLVMVHTMKGTNTIIINSSIETGAPLSQCRSETGVASSHENPKQGFLYKFD